MGGDCTFARRSMYECAMTKHTGLHLAYWAMRRRYAAMLMGGGRSPWNSVSRALTAGCRSRCGYR